MTTITSRLSQLSDRYRVLFSDIWGVVHNGVAAYPEACEALGQFRARGGAVVLISNSPRPDWAVMEQLDRLGAPRSAYDAVVSSGEVTRELIGQQADNRCYHIGTSDDAGVFRGLTTQRVGLDEASFIVCSGLRHDEVETVDDYRAELEALAARNLPMICANTDLVVERGTRLILCAGALGAAYEALGQTVIQAGKPYQRIYEKTFAKAREIAGTDVAKSDILAIGDAARTDVLGARDFGIDCLFLTAGIHSKELHDPAGGIDTARLGEFLAKSEAQPRHVMQRLIW